MISLLKEKKKRFCFRFAYMRAKIAGVETKPLDRKSRRMERLRGAPLLRIASNVAVLSVNKKREHPW